LTERGVVLIKRILTRWAVMAPHAVAVVLLLVVSSAPAVAAAPAKNVIVVMADGASTTHTTLTRWYMGGGLLSQDPYIVGAVRTFAADSIITDSAPAATAFATGHKTDDKLIGVLPPRTTIAGVVPVPPSDEYKPVASVLEGAKLSGKAVGLVATSNIQHASPAAYSAHWPARADYEEIGKQQVYLGLDVVLSGGKKYLVPKADGGARKDGQNLLDVLRGRGYTIVETGREMKAFHGQRLWGLFAADDLAYDMDRATLHPEQPSLAEMTAKAIELLAENPNGFLLFVEASKVDWASHVNDPIGVISDTRAWAEAVGAALEFARRDGETLVLCFSDHGTGGLSIGGAMTDRSYPSTQLEQLLAPLRRATLTAEGVEELLGSDRSPERVRAIVGSRYGLDNLTDAEVAAIQKAKRGSLGTVIGPLLSERSILAWTTHGHTGEDVLLYAYGPNKPAGLIDNTRLATLSAESLGFDLDDVGRRLFVEAGALLAPLGATVELDCRDPASPVLVVRREHRVARIPCSQNVVLFAGKSFEMTGLTVYAPSTGKVYLPRQAAEILQSAGF